MARSHHVRTLLAALLLCCLAPLPGRSISAGGGTGRIELGCGFDNPNEPPVVSADLPADGVAFIRQEIRFPVTVTDAEGDRVDLQLLDPPPGVVFVPAVDAATPLVREVVWRVAPSTLGQRELHFEARDHGTPARVGRLMLRFRVQGADPRSGTSENVHFGDVTGDGRPDLVARATNGTFNGVFACGTLAVFPGGADVASSEGTVLYVPEAGEKDFLGSITTCEGVQLADVTGDGLLDVIAVSDHQDVDSVPEVGAIFVWAGGSSLGGGGSLPPTAALLPPAQRGILLGQLDSCGQGILVADVTADGVADVVAGSSYADERGVDRAGAVFVWAGGAGLAGDVAPRAVLSVPGAQFNDLLGYAGGGQGLQLGDLDADGRLDVIAAASLADFDGIPDSGAIYVWKGGSDLEGDLPPDATLYDPDAQFGDMLCGTDQGHAFDLRDVDGDGRIDLVTASPGKDLGTMPLAGAIQIWAGSHALSGLTPPTATLTIPFAKPLDTLGAISVQPVHFGDVTGDGVVDVVSGSSNADVGGVEDAGALYVWSGGPGLVGHPSPVATLRVPGAVAGDRLGRLGGFGGSAVFFGHGIHLRDLNGDGTLDVLSGSLEADVAGVVDAGALYLWAGGPALSGTVAPTATLTVPGAQRDDQLGFCGKELGILLEDVTGDGAPDVIAGAHWADAGGVDRGALYVWAGGAGLAGAQPPLATLAGRKDDDRLGRLFTRGFEVGDVTGDGIGDVLAGSYLADVGTAVDAGMILVWQGGPTLAGEPNPTARLRADAPEDADHLGYPGFRLVDLTGDGVLDVASGAMEMEIGGVANAGAVFLWAGGPALVGSQAPDVTLARTFPSQDDYLPSFGVVLGDISGDGRPDLLAGSPVADVNGSINTGVLLLQLAPIAAGSPPDAELTVPGAPPEYRLGG